MPYDRNAAIDYAKRFWNQPCDDGVFWLSDSEVNVARKRRELGASVADGWEARFIPDGKGAEEAVFQRSVGIGPLEVKVIQPWEGLADCAHFLSRCLTTGGLKIALLSVPKLVRELQSRSDTKTLGEKVSQAAGQRIVNSGVLKQGDMIGYFNIDPHGDYGGAREYSHSTMYAGKLAAPGDEGHVTCHTKSRFPGLSAFPDVWYLEAGSYAYTMIHIASDDAPPTRGAALEGWWDVVAGPDVFYYYLFRDGRARWARRPPARERDQPNAHDGSGYWFEQPGRIVFTWRSSGSVEFWKDSPGSKTPKFDTKLNDATSGTATRLF